MRSKVDLPEPLIPSRATFWPRSMPKESPSKRIFSPQALRRSWAVRTFSAMVREAPEGERGKVAKREAKEALRGMPRARPLVLQRQAGGQDLPQAARDRGGFEDGFGTSSLIQPQGPHPRAQGMIHEFRQVEVKARFASREKE